MTDYSKAALTMDLNNAVAIVLTVDEREDYAEVTVKVRVPRDYAANLEVYQATSAKRSRK